MVSRNGDQVVGSGRVYYLLWTVVVGHQLCSLSEHRSALFGGRQCWCTSGVVGHTWS